MSGEWTNPLSHPGVPRPVNALAGRPLLPSGGDFEADGLDTPANHRKLVVWQQAIRLVELIYRETADFPRQETFGLALQLRRCAVSIPANIAEGAGKNSTRELAQFIGIASGSKAELDTHLEIAVRLGFVRSDSEVFELLNHVGRLLIGLRKSLRPPAEAA